MKTIQLKFLMVFLLIFTVFSYSNETLIQDETIQNIDLHSKKVNAYFEVESDIISIDGDCYTVNVRVYRTMIGDDYPDTTRKLIANEDVQVGDCEEEEKPGGNSHCESGYLPNGDFVYSNSTTNPECLLELLRNEDLYKKYLISVNTLLLGR